MIGILDSGVGNVNAFLRSYELLGLRAIRIRTPQEAEGVDGLVLPGVGSFDMVMRKLELSGLRNSVDRLVTTEKMPILGVCVGMQIMASDSEEGKLKGFGWIDGSVDKMLRKIPGHEDSFPLPHMGWNTVFPSGDEGIFAGIGAQRFYFLHSYGYRNIEDVDFRALTNYGVDFVAAFQKDNLFGVQFHPEKSHRWGLKLLENFAREVRDA